MELKEKTYEYTKNSGLNEILTFIFEEVIKNKPKDLLQFSIDLLKKKMHKVICIHGQNISSLKDNLKNLIDEGESKFLDFAKIENRKFGNIFGDLNYFPSYNTHYIFILNYPNNIKDLKDMFDRSIFPDRIFLLPGEKGNSNQLTQLKNEIQQTNFLEIKKFYPENTYYLEFDQNQSYGDFLIKNLLSLKKIHNKAPYRIFLFFADRVKNEEIAKFLSHKINSKTINCNSFVNEKKELDKSALLQRIRSEDVKLQGCILYNFDGRFMKMENLMKNIEIFEFFNIFVTSENSKKNIDSCICSNIQPIVIDLEQPTEISIQKIIYDLFYFN